MTESPQVKHYKILGFHVIEVCPISRNVSVAHNPPNGTRLSVPLSERIVVFSHAAGLACETYVELLQAWSNSWGVRIFSYDIRGMGKTELPHPYHEDFLDNRSQSTDTPWHLKLTGDEVTPLLVKDFCRLFFAMRAAELQHCRKENRPPPEFILAGHSYGGWLSLLSAHKCHVSKIVMFDIAMLPLKTAGLWALACLFRQRQLHTLAAQVKTRKVRYRHNSEAVRIFKRFPFFKGWSVLQIETFVKANYKEENGALVLRHDPDWEAAVLESQQPSALLAFRSLPKWLRQSPSICLIVGENSEACSHQAKSLFLHHFPSAKWCVLPEGGHMYPFSKQKSLLSLLCAIKETYVPSGENS